MSLICADYIWLTTSQPPKRSQSQFALSSVAIKQAGDVSAIVGAISLDDPIRFSVWRDGAKQDMQVNLGESASANGDDVENSPEINPQVGLRIRLLSADEKKERPMPLMGS